MSAMRISPSGLKLIVGFEGKLRLMPDGTYQAYKCPANVWTIYAGVTEGVYEGMIVTEAQGEQMFRREISKFEAAVNRLVKVEINQNQFDALVSFAYNCGEGALARSSILKRLNAGDYVGASRAFGAWNKGGGRVLKGLVARRAREASLFLKPAELAEDPKMPQRVDPPAAPKRSRKSRLQRFMAWLSGLSIFGGVAKQTAENVEAAQGVISPLNGFLSEYGLEVFLAVASLCLIAAAAMLYMQQQDAEDGTYHEREEPA
jgi:lysozyme